VPFTATEKLQLRRAYALGGTSRKRAIAFAQARLRADALRTQHSGQASPRPMIPSVRGPAPMVAIAQRATGVIASDLGADAGTVAGVRAAVGIAAAIAQGNAGAVVQGFETAAALAVGTAVGGPVGAALAPLAVPVVNAIAGAIGDAAGAISEAFSYAPTPGAAAFSPSANYAALRLMKVE